MNRFLRVLSLAMAIIMMLSLTACSDPLKSTDEEAATVLRIGEYEVPYELYRYLVMNYKSEFDEGTDFSGELEEQVKHNVEAALRDIYAIFSVADEYGINDDNAAITSAVDAAVKSYKDGYEDEDAYAAALAEEYMNHSVHTLLQKKQICSDELYYKLIEADKFETDEEFLHDYIYGDGFIRIKQVLVVGESSSKVYGDTIFSAKEQHTDEEAKAIAEKVYSLATSGADFDELVADYGESLFMFSNKDGYYICPGMWDDINSEVAFELEIGEVSEVIESEQGYSVFLRCKKEDEYLEKHYDDLVEDYMAAQFSLVLEERAAELEIEYVSEISIAEMQ